MNRDILGLSEGVWASMEKCWDQAPSIRPRATDILVLLETASRDWVPPSSEAIASLSPRHPTNQNYSMMEPTDTMSETLPAAIGGGAVDPRGVGQSPPTSNREERICTTPCIRAATSPTRAVSDPPQLIGCYVRGR